MSPELVLELMTQTMLVIVKMCLPLLLTSLIVGVVVSIVQALTQIQEMTLTFVPKMLALFVAVVLAMPFIGATLGTFSLELFSRIVNDSPQ